MKKIIIPVVATMMMMMSCATSQNNNSTQNETMTTANQEQNTQKPPSIKDIEGNWKIVKIKDLEVKCEAVMIFNIEESTYNVKVGNSIFGKFEQVARRIDALTLHDGGMTQMMPSPEEDAVERAFVNNFQSIQSFEISGDNLLLKDENDETVIELSK